MAVDEMKFTVVRGQCNDHDGEPDSSAGVSFVEEGRNAWRSGVAVGGGRAKTTTATCQGDVNRRLKL